MKKLRITAIFLSVLMVLAIASFTALTVFADEAEPTADAGQAEQAAGNSVSSKAIAAAIVVGIAATGGALAMGIAIAKSAEAMSRQPEAAGKINSAMMLGLVFIETAIIYALIVAILIIFVL